MKLVLVVGKVGARGLVWGDGLFICVLLVVVLLFCIVF